MGTVRGPVSSLGWRMFSMSPDPTHIIPLFPGQGSGPCLVGYQGRPVHKPPLPKYVSLFRCNPTLNRNVLLELKSLPIWNRHQSCFMWFFQKNAVISKSALSTLKQRKKNPAYLKQPKLLCESVDGKCYSGASQIVGATTAGQWETQNTGFSQLSFFHPAAPGSQLWFSEHRGTGWDQRSTEVYRMAHVHKDRQSSAETEPRIETSAITPWEVGILVLPENAFFFAFLTILLILGFTAPSPLQRWKSNEQTGGDYSTL